MAKGAKEKPAGPRLPAAKDAAKLVQEGALAMERGQWERAEKRLLAAREQLGQLDPISWPAFQAGQMVMEFHLARSGREAASQVAREQISLAEKLGGTRSLLTALRDLSDRLNTGNAGDDLKHALAKVRDLVGTNQDQDSAVKQLPQNHTKNSSAR